MITTLIILGILTVFIIGFSQVYNRHSSVMKKLEFAEEYRDNFIKFSSRYFKTYNRINRSGVIDGKLYVWLTQNVIRIQSNLGKLGVMEYIAPYQTYKVSNYQIITNAIPKFRDGSVIDNDVNYVDDCLLRYLGYMDEQIKDTRTDLRNPIIWFREGFRVVLSIPIFILNWFGIISNRTVNSIKESLLYKVISGLIALAALLSSLVTIIVGYEETISILKRFK